MTLKFCQAGAVNWIAGQHREVKTGSPASRKVPTVSRLSRSAFTVGARLSQLDCLSGPRVSHSGSAKVNPYGNGARTAYRLRGQGSSGRTRKWPMNKPPIWEAMRIG